MSDISDTGRAAILLDITRTVARARLPAPTGIDRVERAYIDWALARGAMFLARIGPVQHIVGGDTVRMLIDWLDGRGPAPEMDLKAMVRLGADSRLRRAQALIRLKATAKAREPHRLATALGSVLPDGGIYLNTGHDNLSVELMETLARAELHRLVLIHDVIPLDHPEYTRRGSVEKFRVKLDAALAADGLLYNSHNTAERVAAVAERALPPGRVAPLGITQLPAPEIVRPAAPYFLCLGTIEPRKNHDLLINLWSAMWSQRQGQGQGQGGASDGDGTDTPHLRIVGRRGWENRRVFRELDTAPMMGRTVHEEGGLADDRLYGHLAGARALLFPSFAEGYGLPLAEALALGVPVIASDLPALREVGGDVPEWLPADDPAAWRAMIDEYAQISSPRRDAQIARLTRWSPPRWPDHFAVVENAIETILVQARR